jgi:chloramphenicol O-acetyltransferase type A
MSYTPSASHKTAPHNAVLSYKYLRRKIVMDFCISTLPWFSYTALIQPVACADESNPRITWGKYETDVKRRLKMPLTVLLHHALADGIHIAQFYANVDSEIKKAVVSIKTLSNKP